METESYDIAIIGAGPFACFCAFFLCRQNLRIALIYPEKTKLLSNFSHSLHVCWPSLNDPPTRADVAHGHEVAKYLQQFCSNGSNLFFQNILKTLNEQDNWLQAPCFRFGIQDFEKQELTEAVKLGFDLDPTAESSIFKEKNESLICLNTEKFTQSMLSYLQSNNVKFIQASVMELNESQSNCSLVLSNQKKIEAEVTILGNSLNIANLLKNYKEILIPMSDSLSEYKFTVNKTNSKLPLTFRAGNGHVCGSIFQENNDILVKITGPRFLLPQAGAGINLTESIISQEVWEKISRYHENILIPYFIEHFKLDCFNGIEKLSKNLIRKMVFADCYPCDELPILGEFGKLGKILGNTGWLATGFSAGVWAAYIVHELVMKEKSLFLHSRLHSRRLYSKFIKN